MFLPKCLRGGEAISFFLKQNVWRTQESDREKNEGNKIPTNIFSPSQTHLC